jgi:hypothetical protein
MLWPTPSRLERSFTLDMMSPAAAIASLTAADSAVYVCSVCMNDLARPPEWSGESSGESFQDAPLGGLKQLTARYCDYCVKAGLFRRILILHGRLCSGNVALAAMFFIVTRRPYSQAGTSLGFEPCLPIALERVAMGIPSIEGLSGGCQADFSNTLNTH